ncbi:ferric reductase-like transmembrane domain-containing protein [Rhodocyclus purpureus]|uniref:ferredoxin reductase family protein n=1 Tax=Rhodocyclus purpureus TaxID=1067 RepID=UPI001913EA26|nr:ferric reductase-like transmembrane domain-containing protein [Rhodocyclus purpureus]MBK5914278.1 ferric reductase [Rhodocyclus purpureus]
MKTLQRRFITLLLGLSALWLLAPASDLSNASGFFAWRNLLVQYSGVLGIGAMSVAMILAVRPTWLEGHFGGLDKMYRLHKWLGIAGLVISILHWLSAKGPKWLVGAGLLERPPRGKAPEQTVEIFRFFQSQRGFAESIGEWAFYLAVVLIAIALIKRFPWRWFFASHRWLAVVYLALVLHSVPLLSFANWASPLGVVVGALMIGGSLAALISLFRRIGVKRRAVGVIERAEFLEGPRVNAIGIQLRDRWPGHAAGQFAFVTFHAEEGAHPFTISSAWKGDGKLLFLVKALGDYTRTLASSLRPGDVVSVEGPYGRFDFEGAARRQIWIGAGIGITPFIARMQSLAVTPDGRVVDLYHCRSVDDPVAGAHIAADAQAAGVRLHVLVSGRDARLSGERLRAEIPDWRDAEVWFCGPSAFGDAIRSDLEANGLPEGRFHQELFAMR